MQDFSRPRQRKLLANNTCVIPQMAPYTSANLFGSFLVNQSRDLSPDNRDELATTARMRDIRGEYKYIFSRPKVYRMATAG